MKPSELRAELLGEHGRLREMIDEARAVAKSASEGELASYDLRIQVTRLADAVRRHNLREEQSFREVLPTIDGWEKRSAMLLEEHIREHEELFAALIGIPFAVGEFAGIGVSALLDMLLKHMDREENAILDAETLRDDAVVPRQPAG
jgi:hypothetical protein